MESITTEPRIWERRRDRGASRFKAPKPPSQISNRIDAKKRTRMAEDTFEEDGTNHDYLEEDVGLDDLVIPSSAVDNFAGNDDSDEVKGAAKPLQVQMTEL
jgi:hypothetical protein